MGVNVAGNTAVAHLVGRRAVDVGKHPVGVVDARPDNEGSFLALLELRLLLTEHICPALDQQHLAIGRVHVVEHLANDEAGKRRINAGFQRARNRGAALQQVVQVGQFARRAGLQDRGLQPGRKTLSTAALATRCGLLASSTVEALATGTRSHASRRHAGLHLALLLFLFGQLRISLGLRARVVQEHAARHLALHRCGRGRRLVALLRLATAVLPAALLPASLARTALAAFCGIGCGLGLSLCLRLRLGLFYGLDLGLLFLFLLLDFGLGLINRITLDRRIIRRKFGLHRLSLGRGLHGGIRPLVLLVEQKPGHDEEKAHEHQAKDGEFAYVGFRLRLAGRLAQNLGFSVQRGQCAHVCEIGSLAHGWVPLSTRTAPGTLVPVSLNLGSVYARLIISIT